jgi:hypothetical protein
VAGPSVLDHLGPYTAHPPIRELSLLTQRTWAEFHLLTGGPVRTSEDQRQFLASRMMYISEVMSRSIRVNASWALTHAAMSLLRDRYEQAVRFSWLARQPDGQEFEKFLLHFYSKMRALLRNVSNGTRKKYAEIMGPLPTWATEEITKEQREKMRQWETLDLRTMATRRDALPRITELAIGSERLAYWYDSIYSQFSSVSHFDMYSIQLLELHRSPDGQLVLATNPYWPALLVLQNCLFDIPQCFEAAHSYYQANVANQFNDLYFQWFAIARKMDLAPETLAKVNRK